VFFDGSVAPSRRGFAALKLGSGMKRPTIYFRKKGLQPNIRLRKLLFFQ
jgi:hypothetical protein